MILLKSTCSSLSPTDIDCVTFYYVKKMSLLQYRLMKRTTRVEDIWTAFFVSGCSIKKDPF